MARDAIHRRGQTEKQPSCRINTPLLFVSSRIKDELWELQALSTMCGGAERTLVNGENCRVVCQGQTLSHHLKVVQSKVVCVRASVSTCACRWLSAPAGGSSSWPCTRPPSASVPPRCRSAWAGVCTCSQGNAPDAACSASPALHSTAASPGWTCPSIWSLKSKGTMERSSFTEVFSKSGLFSFEC